MEQNESNQNVKRLVNQTTYGKVIFTLSYSSRCWERLQVASTKHWWPSEVTGKPKGCGLHYGRSQYGVLGIAAVLSSIRLRTVPCQEYATGWIIAVAVVILTSDLSEPRGHAVSKPVSLIASKSGTASP